MKKNNGIGARDHHMSLIFRSIDLNRVVGCTSGGEKDDPVDSSSKSSSFSSCELECTIDVGI